MKKSLLAPLTKQEMVQSGGKKIKAVGKRKRNKIMMVLSGAHGDKRRTLDGVVRELNDEFGSKRDWKRVAITERTDNRARASFDLIESVFGKNARVYRQVSPSCCDVCCGYYGKPSKPKIFKLKDVMPKFIGAAHPNCICGPWVCIDQPDLTKSQHGMADIPIGIVKRVWNESEKQWEAEISTGTGYWVKMDSITGRSIIGVMLAHIPAVLMRYSLGFTVLKHGYFKITDKTYTLYDLRKLGGARFYRNDLGSDDDQELRNRGMTELKTWDEYVSIVKATLATVATMPEYWENAKIRWLPDFMGYKTLTDWIVVVPGDASSGKIKTLSLSRTGLKMAIRKQTYASLEGDDLKK